MPELNWVALSLQVFQAFEQHSCGGFEVVNEVVLLRNESLNFLVKIRNFSAHGLDYLEHFLLARLDHSFFGNLDEVGRLHFSGLVC
jgi:hypothetical protein